jgi:D-alanyl-D-alanine carboxypeptidase
MHPSPHRIAARRRIAAAAATGLAVVALLLLLGSHGGAGRNPVATIRAAVERHIAPDRPVPAAAGRADGYVAEGQSISPFDGDHPAIANLRPALRRAIQRAAVDARAAGVTLRIDSGWRSARYQQVLLDRAIATYGSEQVARQYVNTPQDSTHVTGQAVDVGPTDADSWLAQHGNAYGLCQIYANEIWHFERVTTPGGTCPATIANAAGG